MVLQCILSKDADNSENKESSRSAADAFHSTHVSQVPGTEQWSVSPSECGVWEQSARRLLGSSRGKAVGLLQRIVGTQCTPSLPQRGLLFSNYKIGSMHCSLRLIMDSQWRLGLGQGTT